MKPIYVSLLALVASTIFAGEANILEQSVIWKGSMPAAPHDGTLTISEVHAEAGEELSMLKVVIDMDSLENSDIKKEKSQKKLVKHLKSKDFFHVEEYPTASFTLKEVNKDGVVGTLTIRGVDVERTLPLVLGETKEGVWNLKGTFTFDRQKYGVAYQNSGILGTAKDKLISDEVTVSIDLTFSVTE